jgi:hypothetical protein
MQFGWGFELTTDQLARINERRSGTTYFDTAAAMAVRGSVDKLPLEESPFVIRFKFGVENGYWTGDHMIIQVEDCIDCLRELFGETYDFVFLFDHSSGHAKKRVGGLNVVSMNKGWGGDEMRSTMIVEGCLGPFHSPTNPKMVQLGEMQSLVYGKDAEVNDGPFYLSDDDKVKYRDDFYVALADDKVGMKNKSRKELIAELKDKYDDEKELSKKNLKDLRKLATKMKVDIQKHVATRKVNGWAGKGKGLLQILFERGYIDETKLAKYRMNGVVDEAGIVNNEFSLPHIMETCVDFANEMSQLEYVCSELGATE